MSHREWFQFHPLKDAILANMDKCFPVRLHGDDAGLNKNTAMFVMNMSGVCSRLDSWLSRLIIFCMPLCMCLGHASFESIMEAVVWSLELMSPDLAETAWPLCQQS